MTEYRCLGDSLGDSTVSSVTARLVLAAMLIGFVVDSGRVAVGQTWSDEPAGTVLVESGAFAGAGGAVGEAHPWMSEGTVPEQEQSVGDGAWDGGVALCADGCCNACNGTGCDACPQSSLIGHLGHAKDACWIGRADALLLWRNAPPDRPLIDLGTPGSTVLDANGMDSTPAAGPRFSIFRVNNRTGHAIEATYLRAANFRSIRPLDEGPVAYQLAPPGIYGNTDVPFDSGNANLGSRLQSFEFNRHHCHGRFLRFLAGFRWIEWQEQFTLDGQTAGGISDFYQTDCINDLYGGQIGVDANFLALPWIRFDGLVKAGAYYNNAVQSSEYTTDDPANPGTATVRAGESPLSGAFAGEVGLTGVIPLTRCIDLRVGYFGLWLSGIAQPTQQLSGQQLTPGEPEEGSINANGGVIVQGVSLGLEGRW